MKRHRHLIIGCGSAALSAVKEIRRINREDDVSLVTMEDCPPYSPMSLPYLISGRIDASGIQMVPEDYFEEVGATWRRGRRVVSVDTGARKVFYDNAEADPYDTLLIATGSDALVPPLLGEAGCLPFHTIDDYARIMKRLGRRRKVAILGAGLVGMELAAALHEKGHPVHLIDKEARILMRYFGEEAASRIARLFRERGIILDLDWGESVAAERRKGGIRVDFEHGQSIDTDTVIVCVGVAPRTSFLRANPIKVSRGIVVDQKMRTNVSGVFAAGDVAEAPDFFTGQEGLNPVLPSAVEQGRVAGRHMAGGGEAYEGWLPMNTFNFFGHKAISVGRFAPLEGDETITREDRNGREYMRIVFREGRMVGANFLNADVDAGVVRGLIMKRVEVGKYKDLLRKKPREAALSLMLDTEREDSFP